MSNMRFQGQHGRTTGNPPRFFRLRQASCTEDEDGNMTWFDTDVRSGVSKVIPSKRKAESDDTRRKRRRVGSLSGSEHDSDGEESEGDATEEEVWAESSGRVSRDSDMSESDDETASEDEGDVTRGRSPTINLLYPLHWQTHAYSPSPSPPSSPILRRAQTVTVFHPSAVVAIMMSTRSPHRAPPALLAQVSLSTATTGLPQASADSSTSPVAPPSPTLTSGSDEVSPLEELAGVRAMSEDSGYKSPEANVLEPKEETHSDALE